MNAACPICSSPHNQPVPFHRDEQLDAWRGEIGDSKPYGWFFCWRCTSIYPSQQPDLRVLARAWQTARVSQESESEAETRKRRAAIGILGAERSFRTFAALAPSSHSPKRFLDIACGFGQTVRKYADSGWEAEGVDADPVTAPYHRDIGIRSHIGQFEGFDYPHNFTIIHISHAIYFITKPMQFIREVRRHLQPDGLFCIIAADFLANEDPGLPSYVHSFQPNGRSLRYALALAGFETIYCKRKHGSIYLAARPAPDVPLPRVYPRLVLMLWRTKQLRYQIFGRPHLALRNLVKSVLTRVGLRR